MHKYIITILSLILIVSDLSVIAQNNTNSPYTRFGYGEISDCASGRSRSMGGVSYAIRSNRSINPANPASYTSVDSMSFLFEVGAMGRISTFSNSDNNKNTSFTANIEYLNMMFPIGKWLAASIGITPYSFVGYDFTTKGLLEIPYAVADSVTYTNKFSGSGGINQVHIGLAGRLGKHVSIGINAYYIFGKIQNTRNITFDQDYGIFYSTLQNNVLSISDFNLRYGIQYYTNIKKDHFISIGAIAEIKNKLSGDYSIQTSTIDTISEKNGSRFETPLTIGAGLSYGYKDNIVVGFDVLHQFWSDVYYFDSKDYLFNYTKISFGAEYVPNRFHKNYFLRMNYRLGFYMSEGYLEKNDWGSPQKYGITFGIGFPARGSRSAINLGFEYGRIGARESSDQIREDYFKISINAMFNEMWFFKRKIN